MLESMVPALVQNEPIRYLRDLVLNAVSAPLTKRLYAKALDDFFLWRQNEAISSQGQPAFDRAGVQAHKAWLEAQSYAAASVNQKLAALRKLAREAAAAGLLDAATAAGIDQVPGVKQRGTRAGNWLTKAEAQELLNRPDGTTLKGKRDRALLALLTGCGLRRNEATALTVADLQLRDGRWVLVDLHGKHGRIRTVPVPAWVYQAIHDWLEAASIDEGKILRAINRHDTIAESLTGTAVRDIVRSYRADLSPHDLRRTCAKLCRSGGGELEQIQLLLGHASIQTTERYLGTQQDLVHAPNDTIKIRIHG
jgi:integrase/recombinase XerD